MLSRRSWVRVALVSLATLIIAGGAAIIIDLRAFQLRYYEWQMQRARQQAYGGPKTTEGGFVVVHVRSEAEERYVYYRQKLVELGGIVERHYLFYHLRVLTDDSRHLKKLLLFRRCPNYVDFLSPYPDKPEPMQLTVWCRPTDASAWDDFVAEHDVPNHDKDFVGRNSVEEQPGASKKAK